jgi:hypothetical protein
VAGVGVPLAPEAISDLIAADAELLVGAFRLRADEQQPRVIQADFAAAAAAFFVFLAPRNPAVNAAVVSGEFGALTAPLRRSPP